MEIKTYMWMVMNEMRVLAMFDFQRLSILTLYHLNNGMERLVWVKNEWKLEFHLALEYANFETLRGSFSRWIFSPFARSICYPFKEWICESLWQENMLWWSWKHMILSLLFWNISKLERQWFWWWLKALNVFDSSSRISTKKGATSPFYYLFWFFILC